MKNPLSIVYNNLYCRAIILLMIVAIPSCLLNQLQNLVNDGLGIGIHEDSRNTSLRNVSGINMMPNMSIGSTVFYDRNDNGIHDLSDPLEKGIPGVEINLYFDANGNGVVLGSELTPIASTTTNSNGDYFFDMLQEGNYQVGIPVPAPSGQSNSSGQNTTDNEDLTDDGIQALSGGLTLSAMVTLTENLEPIENSNNPGADQDTEDTNGNMTIDFGFIPNMSIGSTVFYDQNNNGIQNIDNPLEIGIGGVVLNLYYDEDESGSLEGDETIAIKSTTTDINGNYIFDTIPEGTYVVGALPSSQALLISSSTNIDEGIDGNNNGSQPEGSSTEVFSNAITLIGNMENHIENEQGGNLDDLHDENGDMTIDFGFIPNMSIGSTVFYDKNDDGIQDLSSSLEVGIAGVQVNLFYDVDQNGVISGSELIPIITTTTNSDGNYYFGNLIEGNYQISIPVPDPSAKASSTGQNTNENIDLVDDGAQSIIGGMTFSPIINLSAGNEPVENDMNSGATADNSAETSGDMTIDFGFIPQMSIGSTVFYDVNNNGKQNTDNPLEIGVEGVVVNLYYDENGNGSLEDDETIPVESTNTDSNGNYLFSILPKGNFIVGIIPPGDALVSSSTQIVDDGVDGNNNGNQPGGTSTEIFSNAFNLAGDAELHEENEQGGDQDDSDDSNGDMTIDFGLVPNMSIGSTVFNDTNDNGIQDSNNRLEKGIEGLKVELHYDANKDGFIAGPELIGINTVYTDVDGNYFFGFLPSGNYQVSISTPDLSAPTNSSGQNIEVNADNTDDGQQGVSGGITFSSIINLTIGNQPIENEDYPGSTLDDSADGNGNMTIDFGFIPEMSVGSIIFYDTNNNGIHDTDNPLEDGVEGVVVNLYLDSNEDGILEDIELDPVKTTVSNSKGEYTFDVLPEGNYLVGLIPTGGAPFNSSIQFTEEGVDGNNNGSQPNGEGTEVFSNFFTLEGGEETHSENGPGGDQDNAVENNGDMTIDFGMVPMMSIGSTVFFDPNENGVQDLTDPLETGVEGILVSLYYDANKNGIIDGLELNSAATRNTDINGNYIFENLPEGNYQLSILTPDVSAPTNSFGQNIAEGMDLTDDGIQTISGGATLSPVINLKSGEEPIENSSNPGASQDINSNSNGDMTVDFGFIPNMRIGSNVFYDHNDNGVQDDDLALEFGIEEIKVNLYFDKNRNGILDGDEHTPVRTTETDENGNYLFDVLPEGNFIVGLIPSEDAPISSSGQNVTDGLDGNDNGTQPDGTGTEVFSNAFNLSGAMETHTENGPGGDQDNIVENNGDMTIDFGLIPNMSIGSTVFNDPNNDGYYDFESPLETGIAGLKVDLYFDSNKNGIITGSELIPVITTETDSEGNYFFGRLPKGNYQVGVPIPDASAKTNSSGQNLSDHLDLTDDGIQIISGGATYSMVVNLNPGEEPIESNTNPGYDQDDVVDINGDMTIDLGFVPNMSIGSIVFFDVNDNGFHDADDPLEYGIEGVKINLYFDLDENGVINDDELTLVKTTTTDANGLYHFNNLPEGNYAVGVEPSSGALLSSTGAFIQDGIDGNDNGSQINGMGTEVLSNIFNLEGNMEMHEENEAGGGIDDEDDFNGDMTIDFGFIPNMSIGSTVFYDYNDNGIHEPENLLEFGVKDVSLNLFLDADKNGSLEGLELTPLKTTTTDSEGNYLFSGLSEGQYIIEVEAPNGAPLSSSGQFVEDGVDGNDNGIQVNGAGTNIYSNPINLIGGMEIHEETEQGGGQDDLDENNGDMTVDFGIVPNMSIGSTIFYDQNNNGLHDTNDATEKGIKDITVQLLYDKNFNGSIDGDEMSPLLTTVSDDNGDYFFGTLPEGNYQIVIPNSPALAPTSSSLTVTMDNGVDNDDNGLQVGGQGTSVYSPVISLLAGEEPKEENGQAGSQDETPPANDENGDMTVDFGFTPFVSVGSNVFVDKNNDGVDQGVQEGGIEGLIIQLFTTGIDGIQNTGDDILVETDITDELGNWFIDSLLPDEYFINIENVNINFPTSSTTDFSHDDGIDNNDNGQQPGGLGTRVYSNEFTLKGDSETNIEIGIGGDQDDNDDNNGDMTIDFGFVPKYSIGNQVWNDENYNGLRDEDESGIEDVSIQLLKLDGTFINSKITDPSGFFLFDSLLPGDYFIIIPEAELALNGTLQNYVSSTGSYNMGGIYEVPGVNPNTDIDNDDNGVYNQHIDFPLSVTSGVISLGETDEPIGEDPHNNSNTLDEYENLTVDFGFGKKEYDVALINEIENDKNNKSGDTLIFDIAIFNQGNMPLTNIEVTDYVQGGFKNVPDINGADSLGWSAMVNNKITYLFTDTLMPNESDSISIYLRLNQSLDSLAYINFAEVSMFADTLGNGTDGAGHTGGIQDKDSNVDAVNEDPGGLPLSPADNYLDGDGTGVVGDGVAMTDEDDHDPAMVRVVDVAMRKIARTPGPYFYGQLVEFDVEIYNQGNVDLEDVIINDYISCAQALIPDTIWTNTNGGFAQAKIDSLYAGDTINVLISYMLMPIDGQCDIEDAYINIGEVNSMVADYDNDSNFTDDVSEEDLDSNADNIPSNDPGGIPSTDSDDYIEGNGSGEIGNGDAATDEDDHDSAKLDVFDLAHINYIEKLDQYNVGDTITFIFKVFNQGNVQASNVQVVNYLKDGYLFSQEINEDWIESDTYLFYNINEFISAGDTFSFSLDLIIVVPEEPTNESWYNESEISNDGNNSIGFLSSIVDADSTPDNNPDNDNDLVDGPDDDFIFDQDDENDNEINENPNDPFNLGHDDEDDNDASGIQMLGGLSGTVWEDIDGDGIQDDDEPGIPNVIVRILDCDGNEISTQFTDESGLYNFNNILAGDYQVIFDLSNVEEDFVFTLQNIGDDNLDNDADENGATECINARR